MECPACRFVMSPVLYEGIEIDVCRSCRGVWLDQGELEKIVKVRSQRVDPKLLDEVHALAQKSRAMPTAEFSRQVPCPVCGGSMKPVNYQYSSNIILNRCPAGHGIWLDDGELEKIRTYREAWLREVETNKVRYAALAQAARLKTDMLLPDEDSQEKNRHSGFLRDLLSGVFKLDF